MAKKRRFKTEKARKRVSRKTNPFFRRTSQKYFQPTRYTEPQLSQTDDLELIQAPKNFSIMNNTNTMLSFFNSFHEIMDSGLNIFIDMERISEISEDAILYLLSRLDYFHSIYPNRHISGNFPKNKKCEELLLESNFTKYVQTRKKHIPDRVNIFPIIDGSISNGIVVSDLLDFVEKRISLNIENSSRIYGSIMELMQNTKEHAFTGIEKSLKKWWLIALPDKKNKKIIHFTFLDNGAGIPQTIEMKNREKIKAVFPRYVADSQLLLSALKGEFRTQTLKRERGKGLPSVFEMSDLKQIKNMVVLSRRGYVEKRNEGTQIRNINSKFHGTLFSWDFIN